MRSLPAPVSFTLVMSFGPTKIAEKDKKKKNLTTSSTPTYSDGHIITYHGIQMEYFGDGQEKYTFFL